MPNGSSSCGAVRCVVRICQFAWAQGSQVSRQRCLALAGGLAAQVVGGVDEHRFHRDHGR